MNKNAFFGPLTGILLSTTALTGQISLDNLLGLEVINIDKNEFDGGQITLRDDNGNTNVTLTSKVGLGDGSGMAMFNQLQNRTLRIDGNAIGQGSGIFLYDSDANLRLRLRAEESTSDGGAEFTLFNSNDVGSILIDADNDGSGGALYLRSGDDRVMASLKSADGPLESGGHFRLFNDFNVVTAELDADNIGSGGYFQLKDSLGNTRISMIASEKNVQGGSVRVFNNQNILKIELDGDYNGDGRVITDEIEIKGGSDFAEQFYLSDPKASIESGMLVSIDDWGAGHLRISTTPYDKKVAGIVSGANGISSGVIMYEKGTSADGDYPITLSGRTYVFASEENGKILPGDLLTSSSTPGHVMRATKRRKMSGALIGKALTTIDDKGFVLALVNLQ